MTNHNAVFSEKPDGLAPSYDLQLGCSKVDITPQSPLPLAGFAHRQGDFERVERPLYARILFFQQGGTGSALVISADLLWWGAERVDSLRNKLNERFGLSEAQIVLHATHNHSGPQTSGLFTPSLGRPDPEYIAFLEERILDGAEQAARAFEPVTAERGIGSCRLGIYRRKRVDGSIRMAPNPEGPADPEVTVIRYALSNGKTKALLVHYACHPTTSGDNTVSSEFPGLAMGLIEEQLGCGAVSAYVQGCCADVRPALVRDGEFYRGGDEDVRSIGQALASEVLAVLTRPMKPLAPRMLQSRTVRVQLPLQEPPSPDELRKWARLEPSQKELELGGGKAGEKAGDAVGADRPDAHANPIKQLAPDEDILEQWSRLLLSNHHYRQRTVELELSYLELAEGFALLATNAEMAGDYGRFVKIGFGGRVLPVCYSNGMIGYIPTAGQLAEGGYEAVDYIYYFGLPAPLAPEAEEIIRSGIRTLVTA
ncbi:hypothetical protein [Paenibacillus naphthalenovorans]|uniref:hypothetical protein n=1 Tax=Paenibacillus naphthalenovorans TaxID=162209 RepID=UPI003D28918B